MARKQKRFEQVAAAADNKEAVRYQDPIQSQVNKKLEDVGKKFEGKGRTLLYGLGAFVVVLILVGIFYSYNRRSTGAAQTALGKAIETSQARVTDQPVPAGSTDKTFKTEKERADAAIVEFQAVIDKFGGAAGEKALYFIAVTKLMSDRGAGIAEIESIAKGSSDTAKLAKFALAQTRADDGKFDEAAAIYQELAAMPDAVVAKDTINFNLAKVYEKQGKKQEAIDLYFNIAKSAAEAKDADGKALPLTETARDAKDKVTELAPDKAKEIPESTPESPFGN
ncbi:MAG: tetratricopeptide repeat protein [Pyrinomonadaceae bacterium]|nr:tetratricopeptide repeat protein [Pyrinomonadaceae bacterium]MBP6213410.1 tetratricopeptide repeat protein [Pyrinomonadaceae bacterium]